MEVIIIGWCFWIGIFNWAYRLGIFNGGWRLGVFHEGYRFVIYNYLCILGRNIYGTCIVRTHVTESFLNVLYNLGYFDRRVKGNIQKTLGETEDVEGVLGKYLEDGEVAESGLEYGWKLSTVTFVNTN